MGTEGERPRADLIDQLTREPYSFDFFQAVRLLEYAAREAGSPASQPVGLDHRPETEVVRFGAHPSLTFPAGSIAALTDGDSETQRRMTVAFMGLTGPAGVLPQHYTSLLIERAHTRHKDRAMLDFFDLFNHRVVSLFYRAWEKYRFPFAYERSRLSESTEPDPFTFSLFCLTGLGEAAVRQRCAYDDELVLYFGGHFARRTRSATGLRQILTDLVGGEVEVQEFVGQWLYLDPQEQSCLPSARRPEGQNLGLGVETVVGSRVWDVQSRFRIRVGPLSLKEFSDLLPGAGQLKAMCELVRLYVGPEFDFDVQLILNGSDVPACRLGGDPSGGSRLGWDSWIQSVPREADAEDAIFRIEAS